MNENEKEIIARGCKQFLDIYDWAFERVDNLRVEDNLKNRLALGCFHVAMEHSGAVHYLIQRGIYGSAFVLYRTAFEALVKGLWLAHIASERDVNRFVNDKMRHINEFLSPLSRSPALKSTVLSKIHASEWKTMCSYTHSGVRALMKRYTRDQTIPIFNYGEVSSLIGFMTSITFICSIEMCSLAKEFGISREILGRFKNSEQHCQFNIHLEGGSL